MQTFRGNRIEDVLQEVHEQLGEDAEIVLANKKRSGGIAGFFSREQFEVTAAASDDQMVGTFASLPSDDRALQGLLERASGVTDGVDTRVDRFESTLHRELSAVDADRGRLPGAAYIPNDGARPRPAKALVERRLRTAVQVEERPVAAVAVEPQRQHQEAALIPSGGPLAGPAVMIDPAYIDAQPEPRRYVDPPTDPYSDPYDDPYVDDRPIQPQLQRSAAPAASLPARPAAQVAERATDQRSRPPGGSAGGSIAMRELLRSFDGLPVPPEVRAEGTSSVVFIGTGGNLLTTAQAAAIRMGLSNRSILIAADPESEPKLARRDSVLTTPAEIRTVAARRRMHGQRAVFAIHRPTGPATRWAIDAVEAANPDQTRLVIPAATPSEEVNSWVHDIGRIDCLEVVAMQNLADPLRLLTSGHPIASVDGHPATPGLWATMSLLHDLHS